MRTLYIALFTLVVNACFSQDAYHTDLVAYLSENYGIDNPDFPLGSDENSIISNMTIYGGSSVNVSEVSDFNFVRKSTINVPNALNNQWDSGYNTRNQGAIEKGDIVLVAFWAKRNSNNSELFLFAENANNFEKEFYFSFGLTPDWTQYFMAFESKNDYDTNRMSLGFHLGSVAQNFDIAGYTLLNYRQNYDLDGVPSSFENGAYAGSESDAEWREPAQSRIEQLRMSNLEIRIVDENGNGLEGVDVSIEQQEHLFGFGSAFVTCRFPGNDCYDATYVEKVNNLDGEGHGFNVGVTENAVKWDGWEEEWIGSPEETAAAIKYLHDNGVTMRGHTLIWPGFNNMPDDIAQNQDDIAYVRDRIRERINTMINHPILKDIIKEWDVLNEITVNRDLERIFKEDPAYDTGREIYQEIFEKVRALDPELKLYMNDYVVLSGGGSSATVINRYKSFLSEIQASSQPMDGIGFQCHIGSNPTSIYKLEETLNEYYDTYNVPIKITEYDINDLVSDEVAGAYLADFLTMVFSLEAVDAFIMWGFWDGNHWKSNAPMFYEDWTLKPSGQAFIDKVFGEWWTEENIVSDEDGYVNLRAFKGIHKVVATKDGQSREAQVSLDDDGQIQLILEGVNGVDELSASDFIISPNPTSNGRLMLSYPADLGPVDVSIHSLDGRLVDTLHAIRPNTMVSVDLNPAMYLMNIYTKTEMIVKRFIIE